MAGADESGDADGAGGPGGPARFERPTAMTPIGPTGLLVADTGNDRFRRVEVTLPALTVTVTTLAVTFQAEPSNLSGPEGIATLGNGDLLISDQYNQRIRRISANSVASVAGDGEEGLVDGQGVAARFHYPRGIALGPDRALYIADQGSAAVRRMSEDGTVTTVSGNDTRGYVNGPVADARFAFPEDVAVGADGAVYVADGGNHAIRKIVAGSVSTVAGTGTSGFMDGPGDAAQFATPKGVAVHPDGRIFVADSGNQRIRMISATGTVTTLTGAGPETNPVVADGPPASARLVGPARVAITAAGLAITDGHRLRLLVCR